MTEGRNIRGEMLIWRCGVAEGRPTEPGSCAWCGEPIVLLDPSDYRRRARTRHRGDEHEAGDRNCAKAFRQSRCWSARDLVWLRGDPCCVDCGNESGWWDADHDAPLVDGGAHCPSNIVRRCVPCHRQKTAREASERAERRRGPAPESNQLELAAA